MSTLTIRGRVATVTVTGKDVPSTIVVKDDGDYLAFGFRCEPGSHPVVGDMIQATITWEGA